MRCRVPHSIILCLIPLRQGLSLSLQLDWCPNPAIFPALSFSLCRSFRHMLKSELRAQAPTASTLTYWVTFQSLKAFPIINAETDYRHKVKTTIVDLVARRSKDWEDLWLLEAPNSPISQSLASWEQTSPGNHSLCMQCTFASLTVTYFPITYHLACAIVCMAVFRLGQRRRYSLSQLTGPRVVI